MRSLPRRHHPRRGPVTGLGSPDAEVLVPLLAHAQAER